MKKIAVLAVIAVLGLAAQSFADTIKLNSGETITGEIVLDAGPTVKVRVSNASGTIFSVRDVLRSDIKEIRRGTDSETTILEAVQNYRRYQLAPNSYPLAYYDSVISGVFMKFLNTYPQSMYRFEVQNALKAWNTEREEVARGSIKRSNQWYRGDEAKMMAATIQMTQLIDAGDSELQLGKYESAISQYRRVLQQRPLTEKHLSLIETKCANAFTKWTASVITGSSNPETEIQSRRQTIEQLQRESENWKQQIANIEKERAFITAAHWERTGYCSTCGCRNGHWISGERDFGSTLPDAKSLTTKQGLTRLQDAVSRIEREIARCNTVISTVQSSADLNATALATLQNSQTQLATEIANVKTDLLNQPAKVEAASVATNEMVAQQDVTSKADVITNVVIAQQEVTPKAEVVQPAEPRLLTDQVHKSTQENSLSPKQSWWKEYWYLLAIGIMGSVFILRRRC